MTSEKFYRVNEKIRFSPVVVIDSDGQNLGSIPLIKAKELAYGKNLDLVEVSSNARPPVCRIMDYGKFKYKQEIKEKKARQAQKQSQIKEIRLSCGIADHDIETKYKSVIKFLASGHKVHVKLEFKRRENNHKEIGFKVIKKFLEKVSDFASITKNPSMEGKFILCILEPKETEK